MQLKNVAAVMVTAKIPPFARSSQAIDVVVSSMGNAKSLRAAPLLMTRKGVDGQGVYALAGAISGRRCRCQCQRQRCQVDNWPAARISSGATVERELRADSARAA